MIVTDFARALNRYFNDYLINDRCSAVKTIETYRYSFIQLVEFMETEKCIQPGKIQLKNITKNTIISMLNWLEDKKNVSIATRNQRLAAFKSFATFLKYENPEFIKEMVEIQSIKLKKYSGRDISYLKPEGIKLMLSQVNQNRHKGRRDYMILALMFTTGIRVSELIGIRGCDVSISTPKSLVIHGKGAKIRHVPIVKQVAPFFEKYLKENKCLLPQNLDEFIFKSHTGAKFTRQGINYTVTKYATLARGINPSLIPKGCSPHKIRHSSAMSLLEDGVDLITIRDLLGHSSVQTTEIYAKISATKSRAAIEAASKEIVPHEDAIWENSSTIKEWLKGMNRNIIM